MKYEAHIDVKKRCTVLVFHKGDNCGTGSGGFQPGNDCAAGDGSSTKEPKGKPGKDKEKQQAQTKTPQFKEWFGNSKVVNENGDPLVVYHGTESPGHATFDPTAGTGGAASALYGEGVYFSTRADYAESYAKETGAIYPAYLRLENPFIVRESTITGKGKDLLFDHWSTQVNEHWANEQISKINEKKRLPSPWWGLKPKLKTQILKESGFDGVIDAHIHVAFDSKQIKSSTSNDGSFDPDSDNINKSADNCGTGAGGFQPGNSCASGDGSSSIGNKKDAVEKIREQPDNIMNGWFRNGDANYKDRLANLIQNDPDLLEAGKRVMFDNWSNLIAWRKPETENMSYAEFLNTPQTFYRAGNIDRQDSFVSFTQDREVAEKHRDTGIGGGGQRGGKIVEVQIKPKDTWGSYTTTSEMEVLVPPSALPSQEQTKAADNCGTGAGGFQPGNDCAAGDGSSSASDGKTTSKPNIDQLKEKYNELWQMARYVEGNRTVAEIIADTDIEKNELLYLLGEAEAEINQVRMADDRPELVGDIENAFNRTNKTVVSLFDAQSDFDDLVKNNKPGQNAARLQVIENAHNLMRMSVSDSYRQQYAQVSDETIYILEEYVRQKEGVKSPDLRRGGWAKYFAEVDEGAKTRIHDKYKSVDSIDTTDFAGFQDAMNTGTVARAKGMTLDDYKKLDTRAKQIAFAAKESASDFFKKIQDEPLSGRMDIALSEARAAEQFLASNGISATVDVACFAGNSADFYWREGGDKPIDTTHGFSKQEFQNHVQMAYEQIYSVAEAKSRIEKAGIGKDLFEDAGLQINVTTRQFGKDEQLTMESTRRMGEKVAGCKAYFSNRDKRISVFTDSKGDSYANQYKSQQHKDYLGTDQSFGTVSVVTHEFAHALHNQNLRRQIPRLPGGEKVRYGKENSIGSLVDAKLKVLGAIHPTNDIKMAWGTAGAVGDLDPIGENISTYARTCSTEFIAESTAIKVLEPDRWEQIKNTELGDGVVGAKTIGELYDVLGGA